MCELRRQEFREREAVDSSGQQRIAVGIYGGYREIIFFIFVIDEMNAILRENN